MKSVFASGVRNGGRQSSDAVAASRCAEHIFHLWIFVIATERTESTEALGLDAAENPLGGDTVVVG